MSTADGAPKAKATLRVRLSEEPAFRGLDDKEVADRFRKHLLGSLQLQHLLVLTGSGTSLDADGPSMGDLWSELSKLAEFAQVKKDVHLASEDVEELLSRCDALLVIQDNREVRAFYDAAIRLILERCRLAGKDSSKLTAHKDLLRRLSRRRARDSRLKVFTTNYDRCFELAAGTLGLIPIDGFSFTQPRRFDPRHFEYDIVRRSHDVDKPTLVPGVFHYVKLHGSVDWARTDGHHIEIDAGVCVDKACLIYPAQAKFQRSYEQPHLELMSRYLAALREPNTCLIVAGFGLNDAHLTAPILSALETNPHFRLIIVDPSASKWLEDESRPHWAKLSELAKRADVAFVEMKFAEFVQYIPDLAALSPAEDLARAIQRVTGDMSK